jgi:hypothetical protein
MPSDAPEAGEPRTFVHQPGDDLAVSLRIQTGGRLTLELRPAGGYAFSAIESSDPLVAEVTGGAVGDDGMARAEVVGRRGGSATLRAATWFTGDRFGPPTRLWQMTLDVEP